MKLYDLLNQWFKDHSQAEFAEAAGVRESTVSRWKNDKIPPTFENCLRIAKALNVDPVLIFEAAEKPEYAELFRFFSPNYEPQLLPEPPRVCPEDDANHMSYHEKLEDIFHQNEKMAGWIMGNIITFHAALKNPPESTGAPAEGQHGPGKPLNDLGPGKPLYRSKRPKKGA